MRALSLLPWLLQLLQLLRRIQHIQHLPNGRQRTHKERPSRHPCNDNPAACPNSVLPHLVAQLCSARSVLASLHGPAVGLVVYHLEQHALPGRGTRDALLLLGLARRGPLVRVARGHLHSDHMSDAARR